MTKEQFETAEMLKRQISDVEVLIDKLHRDEYNCDPPTRMSGIHMGRYRSEGSWQHDLTQGEVVTIIESLESMKKVLERKFERL